MTVHNETIRNIILNDKENKLYGFEKSFLNNYLKNSLHLGELFEKKIAIYFQILIGQPREKISFNYSTKNAVNIVLQAG